MKQPTAFDGFSFGLCRIKNVFYFGGMNHEFVLFV